jgi:DNA-directed RNA polymerase specialized sigma24 family protein
VAFDPATAEPTRRRGVEEGREYSSPMKAMSTPESTCWTVIRAAAAGSPADREELARRYLGVVRAYLGARWRGSLLLHERGDAVQEVFLECFRRGGALEAVGAGRVPAFRAFLYGVIRNVARRFESRPVRPAAPLPEEIDANEESQSRLFERTWARSIMAEAAGLQRRRADERGPEAVRRVELLRLRFEEGLPVRSIAGRWGVDAAGLHHAYALARKEFKAALIEVVAFHHPGTPAELEQEMAGLLKSLS